MNWINVSDARRMVARAAILLASVAFTAACDDATAPEDPVLWESELAGDEVEGLADVSAASGSFAVEIEIANAEPEAELTWRVAAGTCAAPGTRVGAANRYPVLEVDANGLAEAEAVVPAALDEEEDYIVAVLDESGAQPVYVACGALTLVQGEG
jgi:hypothetical protein